MKQIVLAWKERDFKVKEWNYVGNGESRPVLEHFDIAKACMWLNAGTADDIEKAQIYATAQTEAMCVFVYDNVTDPLGRAKEDVLEGN